jgi:hypothetical protein
LRDLHAAAHTLGLQLRVVHASTEQDFDTVFATLARLQPGALVIGTDGFFISRSGQLAWRTASAGGLRKPRVRRSWRPDESLTDPKIKTEKWAKVIRAANIKAD